MQDWRGTEIEPGDTIVYVVKQSTWVETNEAKVISLGTKMVYDEPNPCVIAEWVGSSMHPQDRRTTIVRLASPENITVLAKRKQEN
jgi:hypothetical protein